jgi:8-oxo-dGTP diphosphatase
MAGSNCAGLRPRACAAILQGDTILMVRHRTTEREYWTLPGGAIEPDETPEAAAVREVREETGLQATVLRFLFSDPYGDDQSLCYCFLLQAMEHGVTPGADPEESHLGPDERLLQDVAWLPLDQMTQDGQVAKVLTALSLDIERGRVDGTGESIGYAESLQMMALQLRQDVNGPKGREVMWRD